MPSDRSPAQIEAEIEQTRAELADTVDALHDRLDVKAKAKDKAAEVKDRATTDSGRPRPVVVGAAAALLAATVGLLWRRRR